MADFPKSAMSGPFPQGLFEHVATSPGEWLRSAKKLRRAYETLHRQDLLDFDLENRKRDGTLGAQRWPLTDPMWLLAAFTLENLLKALIVSNPEHGALNRKGNLAFSSHDLSDLAEQAGFELTVDEARLAAVLASCAVSWGRYPTGKSAAGTHLPTTNSEDHPRLLALFDRLEAHTEKTIEASSGERLR